MKNEGHLGPNDLKGRHGDHANVFLTAVGYNFRLILKWLRALVRPILPAVFAALIPLSRPRSAS